MRLAALGVFLAVALALWIPSGDILGAPAQAPAPSRPALGYAPDEVIVKFRDDVDVDPQVFARSIGATVFKSAEHKRNTPRRVFLLKVPAGTVEATVRRLSRNPLVEFAQLNRIYYTTAIPMTRCLASNGNTTTRDRKAARPMPTSTLPRPGISRRATPMW